MVLLKSVSSLVELVDIRDADVNGDVSGGWILKGIGCFVGECRRRGGVDRRHTEGGGTMWRKGFVQGKRKKRSEIRRDI